MSSNGNALLLDRDFFALMFSFVNKVNENEFSWESNFPLIFNTVLLFLKYLVILDRY